MIYTVFIAVDIAAIATNITTSTTFVLSVVTTAVALLKLQLSQPSYCCVTFCAHHKLFVAFNKGLTPLGCWENEAWCLLLWYFGGECGWTLLDNMFGWLMIFFLLLLTWLLCLYCILYTIASEFWGDIGRTVR